jgi:type I restriction enzyme S subunit
MKNERGWPLLKVGEAGRVQLGRQRAPQYQSGKHTRPYVRVANVYEDRLALSDVLSMDFDSEDFAAYRLEHGDILLNEGQSTELVGRTAMWRNEIPDCCFQNTLIRFQPNRKTTVPEFPLALFLPYAQSLVDDFSNLGKHPHIAISVDMLDTGVDVPQGDKLISILEEVRNRAVG